VVADELLSIRLDRPLESTPLLRHAVGEEYADILALLEWAARHDLEQFGRLIAGAYEPLIEHGDLDDRWREPIERVLANSLLTRRIRHLVAAADRELRVHRGEQISSWLEFSLNHDTPEDPVYSGWERAVSVAVDINVGLKADSPLWPTVLKVVAELAASPVPGLQELASDLEGFLLLAQERWDEATVRFEATVARNGTTRVAEAAWYFLGDCQLHAGRPKAALSGYARGLQRAAGLAQRNVMGFQADGIAAALADMGLHEKALEALGASDVLTPEGYRPRDTHPHWPEILMPRIEAARAALGSDRAQAAYARGAAANSSEALGRVLALAGIAEVSAGST
jgi:tetratricopeptide (TPR) repeat protein